MGRNEEFLYMMLESEDFETFLERFDITPDQAFNVLINAGLVDEELLETLMGEQ